jgi:preprotein translocase subunit SecA
MQEAASAQPGEPAAVPGGPSAGAAAPAASAAGAAAQAAGTVVKSEREKLGRNDPCWCGSGKKYKKCHGA